MRLTFFILLIFHCSACQRHGEPVDLLTFTEDPEVIVLEGSVPLGNDTYLYQQIHLKPGSNPGEGSYLLTEAVQHDADLHPLSEITGQYSTVRGHGERRDLEVIILQGSGLEDGVKRSYKADPKLRIITEEMFRRKDVHLQKENDHRFLLLDNQLNVITHDLDFNLHRRASRLFTVEGFFTHIGNQAQLFESNTKETLLVSKSGEYATALRQYYQLRQEKFEKLYIKAVGYTTFLYDSKGDKKEILVLKQIIEMQSSAVSEP